MSFFHWPMRLKHTPFADAGREYDILSFDEAVSRHSIFEAPAPQILRKEYTLFSNGGAQKKIVQCKKSYPRHILRLKDAYVLGKLGVFTQEGAFLPPQFTSSINVHRARSKGGKLSILDKARIYLTPKWIWTSREKLFYADCNHRGYGHFLLEALPRNWALKHLGQRDVRILSMYKQTRELLSHCLPALDVPPGRLIRYSTIVFCKDLYVASQPVHLQRFVDPEAREVWRTIGAYYRQRENDKRLKSCKKIFISRRGIEKRTLKGQEEIEDIFRKKGFFICRPEELSFPQQVFLFSNATHIAAPYGSGMFNALFAQESVSMFILGTHPQFFDHFPCFDDRFTISAYLEEGLSFKKTSNYYSKNWEITNKEYCRNVMETWLAST